MSSMPPQHPAFQLEWLNRGLWWQVTVSGGIDSQQTRIAYWQEIVSKSIQTGKRNLLVIDRKKNSPANANELADLLQRFHSFALEFEKIAVVEPNPQFVSAVQFAEIVGIEHDINVRVFNSIADAEHWLKYGGDMRVAD
jgi:hypothetical protein